MERRKTERTSVPAGLARATLDTPSGRVVLQVVDLSVRAGDYPGAMLLSCDDEQARALPDLGHAGEQPIDLHLSDDGPVVTLTGFFVRAARPSNCESRLYLACRYDCASPQDEQTLRTFWHRCRLRARRALAA